MNAICFLASNIKPTRNNFLLYFYLESNVKLIYTCLCFCMNYLVDIEFLCVFFPWLFCSYPIRERPILHPSASTAETRWILDMGPYRASSQRKLGAFTVPCNRLHKPGPKVSIYGTYFLDFRYSSKGSRFKLGTRWILDMGQHRAPSQRKL